MKTFVKWAILFVLGMLVGMATAQTAKVVVLSQDDAAQAKNLYDQQKALDKAKADFEQKIYDKYLTVEKDQNEGITCFTSGNGFAQVKPCDPPAPENKYKVKVAREGWSGGFEYSEDFKSELARRVSAVCQRVASSFFNSSFVIFTF